MKSSDLPVLISKTNRTGAIRMALKPQCVEVNQLESFVQKGSRFYFASDYVYIFKTITAKHKKTSQVSVVFHDEFVHVVQFHSIKCKKRNHKYCVSIS